MSCSNRKYENPETKQFLDLQEILNDLYKEKNQILEYLEKTQKNLEQANSQIVELKDGIEELCRRLYEREDEINSISLRSFNVEQDNMELHTILNNLNSKIERVDIELENHSH